MIRYRLRCPTGHEFDAWFRSGADYEHASSAIALTCAVCGSTGVEKAIMAPRVAKSAPNPSDGPSPPAQPASPADMRRMIRALHEAVKSSAEYVGPRFAEEAREIHYAEGDGRAIYGEATREEAKALAEEGISVLPLPSLPDKGN